MISFEEESHQTQQQESVPIFAQIAQTGRDPEVRPAMSNDFFT